MPASALTVGHHNKIALVADNLRVLQSLAEKEVRR